MTIRVAINGLGRIGRCLVRALYEDMPIPYSEYYAPLTTLNCYRDKIELVAINELASAEMVVHLLKYDSSHGLFPGDVTVFPGEAEATVEKVTLGEKSLGEKGIPGEMASEQPDVIQIEQDIIPLFNQPDASKLPWAELGVDVVLECSGHVRSKAQGLTHIRDAGAKKILISNPAQSDVDATVVFGVNQHLLQPHYQVVSNASCTTNCLVPILHTLHRVLGILQGKVTTIHSAMNDQPVIDAFNEDLRKARSASHSIIPVSTGLARGVDRIMPELAGCIEAQAIRVPTTNVSVMDISLSIARRTTIEEVNQILEEAAQGPLKGILGFTQEPLVSCDFNHDTRSCVIDAIQTLVTQPKSHTSNQGSLVSLLAWFDNEWAYANRMLDNTIMMMARDGI